ncbi:hypothetical protein CONLIGDRAFT_656948 [Coniochaeta ligniaria NRRL 30616]|uniref:Heterokaryon incompatibility domain-containing protein n=1 Tax=Coniochaeta ligniaria NRRL 30616 TaxID=1408157 RepID=A0A1J7ID04_9PEZI|nr:hypothetical protein CONLIGDRAFT_656948 [Coniochaeta ligniaria NRRL 30616]
MSPFVKYLWHRYRKQCRYKSYEWQPLAGDDIRILTLLPGQFDDEIRIHFTHRELGKTLPPGWAVYESIDGRYMFIEWLNQEEGVFRSATWTHPDPGVDPSLYKPPCYEAPGSSSHAYEAISYVWGSQDDPGLAFVQTSKGMPAGTVSIGRNLESALRHLRYEDKPRKLWVDAICINQADYAEKSVQVRRMARIYQSVSRVIAWIGPAMHGSDLAMATLQYLGAQVLNTVDGWIVPSPDAQEEGWFKANQELSYGPEIVDALQRLLSRAWFSRRWVVQEITLANPTALLQCGRRAIPWFCLRHATMCLVGKSSLQEGVRDAMNDVWHVAQNHCAINVASTFSSLGGTACSDPMDSVYALLGVMPPKFAAKVEVDYSASLESMFRNVFLAHVSHVQRWELFSCDLKHRICGGPSWVPDLASCDRTVDLDTQFSSGYSRICVTYTDADILDLIGLRCATVVTATSAVSGRSVDQVQLVRSWEPPDMDTATYVTGNPLSDVFARTLLQDRTKDRWPGVQQFLYLEDWIACGGNGLFGPAARSATEESFNPFDSTKPSARFAHAACFGRSFVTTAEGYVGLGPDGVESGDVICVLLGCSCPVVLRPLPNDRYLLVGNAFVYGLHDAIPLLGPLPPEWCMKLYQYTGHSDRALFRFANQKTGELTAEDPRLEPHREWERVYLDDIGMDLTGDDPMVFDFFRHNTTGELINYDPRMLPEALEARGVQLRTFALV